MNPSQRARAAALRLLGRRAYSRLQLEQRLARRFPRPAVREALDSLEERGLLDDSAAALQRARSRRRAHAWGALRIRLDLKRQGFDARIQERILTQIQEEDPESECLKRFVETRLARAGPPRTSGDLKRLFDSCCRAGFLSEDIRRQLAPFFARVSWDDRAIED